MSLPSNWGSMVCFSTTVDLLLACVASELTIVLAHFRGWGTSGGDGTLGEGVAMCTAPAGGPKAAAGAGATEIWTTASAAWSAGKAALTATTSVPPVAVAGVWRWLG
jgi:hypothetical protein